MSGFNRVTGLMVIEVNGSNPNGDPDSEGEPRTLGADRRGLISPVSVKRKLRDLLEDREGAAWQAARQVLGAKLGNNEYGILESRGRNRNVISAMSRDAFVSAFWDARVFGNTFLESMKNAPSKGKSEERAHFINTGAVQFGPGVSIAPIDIEYKTLTNKSGVQDDKDRGMAPLAWRFVPHAVYVMPFFVNPLVAGKSGCTVADIELLKFLLPFAYSATASVARPDVSFLHIWYARHRTPLGSCPDYRIIDALKPRKRSDPDTPSRSRDDYAFPTALPDEIAERLSGIEDLCNPSTSTP